MRVPLPPDGAQPDAPISAPGYAIAPNAVLRDARLSRDARLLYVLFDGHAGATGRVRVRDATIAAEMDCCERSFYKWSAELVAAGLILRKGTGRSAITIVVNRVRKPSAELHEGAPIGARTARESSAELHEGAALQRSKSREVTNNNGPQSPARPSAPAQGRDAVAGPARDEQELAPYVTAINAAVGSSISWNGKVRARLLAVRAAGYSPEEAAVLVASFVPTRSSQSPILSMAGFVVDTVLPAIAQGQSAPRELPAQPTPIPPTYVPEPDRGGDPAAGLALVRAALHRQESPV